ncbi:MAG: alpha/beta hydrolase [Mangrovicoccus sp.]|nr:alpha/beta hydrolase [Mangrovicoccus sp.]
MSHTIYETEISYFTTEDGLRLAYDDVGEGVPLLCLAGLTRNTNDFNFARPHLLKYFRVIRLDSRGRGKSQFDTDYHNYNVLTEARDVIALMDHLGIERAATLGTSRGGIISMMIAASHKERLLGVFLNDIGALVEPEGLANICSYLGIPPKYKTFDEAADQMSYAYAKRFPGVSRERWYAQAKNLWRQGENGLELTYDPLLRRMFLEQSASGTLPDMWLSFDALQGLPLALLRGEFSDILSQETADEMRRRRPDMLYATAKNRGHVPFLDEPEALDLYARFAAAVSRPAISAPAAS